MSAAPARLNAFRVAVVAVGLVALAGCGGGGSTAKTEQATTTSTTVAAISKSDYTAQANALCETMNEKIKAIPNPGSDPTKLADGLDHVSTIVSATLSELKALPTPTSDAQQLEDIYAKVDTLLADSAQLTAALRAADTAKASALQATVTADQKAANDASNAYGLTVCGS